MKKILIAASLISISAASASAADLAARPYTNAPPMMAAIYDWSGFYIGANGGWGSSHDRRTFDTLTGNLGGYDATGALAGGQIGYRWQAGPWVFGLKLRETGLT
jgi:outer membrane immunogenic protein